MAPRHRLRVWPLASRTARRSVSLTDRRSATMSMVPIMGTSLATSSTAATAAPSEKAYGNHQRQPGSHHLLLDDHHNASPGRGVQANGVHRGRFNQGRSDRTQVTSKTCSTAMRRQARQSCRFPTRSSPCSLTPVAPSASRSSLLLRALMTELMSTTSFLTTRANF